MRGAVFGVDYPGAHIPDVVNSTPENAVIWVRTPWL
jgi:hypothetical protein